LVNNLIDQKIGYLIKNGFPVKITGFFEASESVKPNLE